MAQRGKHSGAHFKQDPAPKRKRRDKGARQQQRHSSVQAPIPAQQPRRRSKAPVVIIVLVLLAGLGFGGFFAWQHRPVTIVVDGERRTVFRQTSLADFAKGESPSVNPGDYVSVTGKVLREGKGNPYSVSVNSREVSYEDAASFVLKLSIVMLFAFCPSVWSEQCFGPVLY